MFFYTLFLNFNFSLTYWYKIIYYICHNKIRDIIMKTFNDLTGGVQPNEKYFREVMEFRNGYGISVVRHSFSYGNESGLFECAVLKDNEICYSTHITNDVIGWCTEEKVTEIMKQIQEL